MLGHNINFIQTYSYLGIFLDLVLSLSSLLNYLNKRASNVIFQIKKDMKYLTFDAALLIIQTDNTSCYWSCKFIFSFVYKEEVCFIFANI